MRHAARELPSQEVGPGNRRKNAKGFPEVGAPPIFKAPARYKTIGADVIQKAEYQPPKRDYGTKELTTGHILTSTSFKLEIRNDRLYRRIRLARPH
jgi:hypothetical protein